MKSIRSYPLLLFFTWWVSGLFSQTIVSTSPQNRNAVLEEFGGIYCVYCPEGHAISASIQETSPSQVVLINYQAGSYAQPAPGDPDLQSGYGQAINDQTGLVGYPAATVNRLVFPAWEQGQPGTTAMSRNFWEVASAQVLNMPSPVNIAAQASLDIATRELNLYVEYYYTGSSTQATNRLNVAILQNNILGPQLGGGQGNYYPHQHVVRDMLTGQWGELINNPTAGYAGSRTFSTVLPESYLNVPADLANIELAIFIAEGHQHILTGIQLKPVLQSPYIRDANLLTIKAEPVHCGETLSPLVTIRNDGQATLHSLTIEYAVNGGTQEQYLWYGMLAPFASQEITLPPIAVPTEGEITLMVNLLSPNNDQDNNLNNNELTTTLHAAPISTNTEVKLDVRTDDYGYEIYWDILNDSGEVMASGGNPVVGQTGGGSQVSTPFDAGAYGNNEFITETIYLPDDGCYTLRFMDDYGDGLCCFYGNGFYRLRPQGSSIIIYGAQFGALELRPFRVRTALVSASDLSEPASKLAVWPNPLPAGYPLNVSLPAPSSRGPLAWRLLDGLGREVSRGEAWQPLPEEPITIHLPHADAGYYLLHVQAPDGNPYTHPLLILPND